MHNVQQRRDILISKTQKIKKKTRKSRNKVDEKRQINKKKKI